MPRRGRRAKAAARAAARRIPIVGTAVSTLPLIIAARDAGLSAASFTKMETWVQFAKNTVLRYTGYNVDGGGFEGDKVAMTWVPIVAYGVSGKIPFIKEGRKAIGKVFSKFGLRF